MMHLTFFIGEHLVYPSQTSELDFSSPSLDDCQPANMLVSH